MEEAIGGFDEVGKESMDVFALVIVESCYHPRVQEPLEKSAAVLPSTPVFHDDNVPGVVTHP